MKKFFTSHYYLSSISLVLLSQLVSSIVLAHESTHGHGALEVFDNDGFSNSPLWVQIWIGFMMISFVSSLLFVRRHVVARWVIGGFILGVIAMQAMSALFSIPPYSGYIATFHLLFWTPALYLLLKHRPFLADKTPFAIWSGVMTAVLIFSFIFDIRDSFIYLKHVLLG